MKLRPLPNRVREILTLLDAPPRLVAHLTLTHDVAVSLLAQLLQRWPALPVNQDAVLFGSATHDVGKARYIEELSAPGDKHEQGGEKLLLSLGVPSEHARFCRTHGTWNEESPLDDLLVALADTIWKGKRNERLENALVERIASLTREEAWKVFAEVDDILSEFAIRADERLNWQNR
jgi:hypothetical protein